MRTRQDQRRARPAGVRRVSPAYGVGLVLAAAVIWGTIGAANTLRPDGTHPLSVGAARVAGGGLLLILWSSLSGAARVVGQAVRSELRTLRARSRMSAPAAPGLLEWVALGGTAVAVYQLCFFSALSQTGVAVGTVISMSTPPVFAGLFAAVWLRQRVTSRFVVATTLTITGCGVVLLSGSTGRVDPAGIISAGVAGLAFAVYSGSASKLVGAGLPPTGVMAVLFATGGLLLMPVLLISDTSWLRTPQGLLLVVYLAAVTTAVAYALYGAGLRTVRVRTSAVLSLADPGAAALLGLLVLGEPARSTTVLGLVLLFLGLVLVAVRSADAVPGRREGLLRAYAAYGLAVAAHVPTAQRADQEDDASQSPEADAEVVAAA